MIFRKVALERLSSPEQLDQLVQVTDPRGWLALTGLGALLLAAIGWGIWGSIPTESQGEGILLREGGVSTVAAPGTGQIEELLVSVGDSVYKGQPVATIRQEALARQIHDNTLRLAALQRELAHAVDSTAEQKRLRARDLEHQRANLNQAIEVAKKDITLLRDRVEAQQSLLKEGLITKQELLTTQQALSVKSAELASHELDLQGLPLKKLEGDKQLDDQLEVRKGAIREIELSTHELEAQLTENAKVLSPFTGRVLEVLVDRGAVISPSTPLLNVELQSNDLRAVLFVPASAGKKVQMGMPVRVAPSTVKREEFGTLLGKVIRVAEFPATTKSMARVLGNDALAAKLMEQGPPIQVDVALERDPKTPTGFRWSSSRGPNVKISSGTLASGGIVVKTDRPISLVIPTLRESLGL